MAVRSDSVVVEFDDESLVVNAGVVLTSTLINRLGLERLVDETVDLGQRPGAARPGRKVCSLVHAMALGADSIDDCDVLGAGGTEALLGQRVMAPSTLRHLPALVQLRACAPARSRVGGVDPASLVGRRGTWP